MRRAILAVAGVLVIATTAVGLDWTFWMRLITIRNQDPLTYPAWIAPTAIVSGAFESALPTVDADSRALSDDAIRALLDFAERVGSYSLIVHHGGGIQLESYWRGLGPDDVTETYSMAKSVTGLMVGVAVSDGFIRSIDDPVTRYVPEWAGTERNTMTIRHVLQMASGLEHFRFDYRLLQNPYGKAIRLFIGPDMESAILRFNLAAEPGSGFSYNSANTQLLMLILQRATGQRYADYVNGKLWQPLGAKAARLWMDRVAGMPKAYSFFQARPRDWLRLGLAIKNNGMARGQQVIPADWLTQMKTPSPGNPRYGLQLWLGSPHVPERFYNRNTPFGVRQKQPFLVDDVLFFDGGGGQRVYVIQSADLVIVRTGMPSPAWDDGVIPNIVLRDLGQGVPDA